MKKFVYSIMPVLLICVSFALNAQTTYNYTGAPQTYTVPAGVSAIAVDIRGATGGGVNCAHGQYQSVGGCGGRVQATINVTPGHVLNIVVGGSGSNGAGATGAPGGYGGGGTDPNSLYSGTWPGAGGGGGTTITDATAGTTLVVAGGGGGGGGDFCAAAGIAFACGDAGGAGGNTTGAPGNANECGVGLGGRGGTPAAGGAASTCLGTGSAGSAGTGGSVPAAAVFGSGGGGGGWFGGGSGSYGGGGGGGSSYTNPTYIIGTPVHTQGYNCGDGIAIISVACNAGTITGTPALCTGTITPFTDPVTGGAWTSSNTTVATVSGTGVVSALIAGTATISYSSGGCAALYAVTVYAMPSAILGAANVCTGLTTTLTDPVTGGAWSTTAGSGSVSVTAGVVTGTGAGNATVTYSTGGSCYQTVTVTVYQSPTAILGTPNVCSGLTTTLSDGILGGTWSSANTTVATVGSSTGVVTGVGSGGITTITYAMPGNCYLTTPVTVNPAPSAILGSLVICQNLTSPLTNVVSGGTWSSSNPAVGSIGLASGIVTALSAGTTIITYTSTNCTPVTAVVTVNPLPASVNGTLTVCTGLTTTLTDLTPGGGWSSLNPTDAPIDPTFGVVTGIFAGTALISYTLPTGCAATAVVTVNPSPVAISGNFSLCVGVSGLLTDALTGGSWTSSNTTVATIGTNTGIVSPLLPGTSSITYTMPTGCMAATAITVNGLPSGITGTLNSCAGYLTPLSDVSPGGTWSSSNTSVATIGSATGVVNALATGSVTIEYAYTVTGCFASAVFTVDPSPVAITGTPFVCQGLLSTFNDAPSGGTWSASNGNATVSPSGGVVEGVTPGAVTISYTLSTGCFVTYPVTITPAPTPIGGPNNVCLGYSITLTDGVTGGTWSVASVSGAASITAAGLLTGTGTGVVMASYITLACNAVNYNVVVNPLPDPIIGIGNLCQGSSTSLTDATVGGTWSSSDPTATVSSTGVVSGVDTGAGTVISYTLPTGCYQVAPVIIFPIPVPISGTDTVCPGLSVTLSDATPGGVWSSSNGTLARSIALTGEVDGLIAGSVHISYTLISGCYTTIPFKVEDPVPASLTVQQTPDTALCAGTPVSFIPHPVNGGTPSFEWELFGSHLSYADILTYPPAHGDYLTCVMTTHNICASPAVVETSLVVNIYPDVSPEVTVTTIASSDYASYLGEVYTFFTDVTYGGTDPGYQWYVNAAPIAGATNSSFSTHVYQVNDSVSCVVTGNSPCDATTVVGISNTVVIYGMNYLSVGTLSASGDDFSLFPNPNSGSFILSGTLNTPANKDITLEVTDMLGQSVYQGKLTPQNGKIQAEINLGNGIAAGTYLLRVNTEAGTQTFHFVVGK